MPHIIGPNINISEKVDVIEENDSKRPSGVEPTLDPTTVLTDLIANNNGQLPPYQL